ncbi:MAG: hypothetical protein M1835_003180 [Candelina submexicana]|nr:MAG: hypothetical protein M1835_003180 [Candelina submexicana]
MKALTCEPDQQGVETTLSPSKVSHTAFETVPATQLSETDTPLAETPMQLKNLQTRSLSKIPKPPNAFILYRQHHHPLVKASNPSLHNNQISIILGKQWKNESDATKRIFYARAEETKQEQCNANPELHQCSRTSPGRRSRKARSRAPSFAKASSSSIDPVLLNPSLTFDSSSLSVLPFAPDTESVLDRVEASLFSDELPNANLTASLSCTDNCILDPSEVASSTSEPAIGRYVGDEEFARMMSRELGEDI